MHIVFQLYDVLRFGSTVVINVLINISFPKLNNQAFKNFEASGLTSKPKAELFCYCKCRKFIDQNFLIIESKF